MLGKYFLSLFIRYPQILPGIVQLFYDLSTLSVLSAVEQFYISSTKSFADVNVV